MKRIWIPLLLLLLLCCTGCGRSVEPSFVTVQPEATVPPETTPPDGSPVDVTCKGSYTGELNTKALVASAGNRFLMGGELQVWYWSAVAQYRQDNHPIAPDFDRPLDTQVCQIDDSVNSWQQYFLRQALEQWYTAQLLIQCSETVPMPTEEAYQPDWKSHAARMANMPAAKYLYGHNVYYQTNTLHKTYLDSLPQTLDTLAMERGYADAAAMAREAFGTTEKDLLAGVDSYNQGYMYFTALSYCIEPTEEALSAYCEAHKANYPEGERTVDIRHILLVPDDIVQEPEKKRSSKNTEPTEPVILEAVEVASDGTVTCSETAWSICQENAQDLLTWWEVSNGSSEAVFADIANKSSADTGTALDGGAYYALRQGQLIEELDAWCFAPERQRGDATIIRTRYGIHMLYFAGSGDSAVAAAREDYYRQQQNALLRSAREEYPLKVYYHAITLASGEACLAFEDYLYPDIAHERFPEIPLYLQQDYPKTMYGAYPIRTHGCGITTMAMLASYMTDDELTPPEMCARFGKYCYSTGTDGKLFNAEPAAMGFYLREKTYDTRVARAALEEGQIVISCQRKGYWTGGGHYIALESITPDGMVQVRDSNIFNYTKLAAHKNDLHRWGNITADGTGYWIYEDKVVSIPACSRCGEAEEVTGSPLLEDYACHKCTAALLRRNTYLAWGWPSPAS